MIHPYRRKFGGCGEHMAGERFPLGGGAGDHHCLCASGHLYRQSNLIYQLSINVLIH